MSMTDEPLPWLIGAASDETARVVADVKAEAVWLVLHTQANGTREDIQSALRTLRLVWGDPPPVEPSAAPQPAVPDGEDEPRLRTIGEELTDCPCCGVGAEVCAGVSGCCEQCAEVGRLNMHAKPSERRAAALNGEDVPARLDAAADALVREGRLALAAQVTAVARYLAIPGVRTAVAAALARTSQREEQDRG